MELAALPGAAMRAPKSMSSFGKTSDAIAAKHDGDALKIKIHKSVKLRPWDGIELIESLNKASSCNRPASTREEVIASSPRVNPLLADKDVAETTELRLKTFLTSLAADQPEVAAAPAVHVAMTDYMTRVVQEEEEAQRAKMSEQYSIPKARPPRPESPSAAFLAPNPREASSASRGPVVAQYHPKFRAVERVGPSVKIAKPSNKRPNTASLLSASHHHTYHDERSMARDRRREEDELSDSDESRRKKQARRGTSSFKSKVERFVSPGQGSRPLSAAMDDLELAKMEPGPRAASATLSRLPRDTSLLPKTCGPHITDRAKDAYRPKSGLDFGRSVARENHKSRIMYRGCAPEHIHTYSWSPDAMSTHPRIRSATPLGKRLPKPSQEKVDIAVKAEPLDGSHNSIATHRIRGQVNIARMVYREEPFINEAHPAPERSLLDVSVDLVTRRPPSCSIPKAQSTAPMSRPSTTPTTFESKRGGSAKSLGLESYTNHAATPGGAVDVSPVRRRPPAASMKGTNREAPVMRAGRPASPDCVYNSEKPRTHMSSPNIAASVSRKDRDRIHSAQGASGTDTMYDVPAPKARGIVPFGVMKGR